MSTFKRWLLFRAADFLSALCFSIFVSIFISAWDLDKVLTFSFLGLFVWYFFLLYLPVTIFVSAYFIRRAEFKTKIKYELWFFGIHTFFATIITVLTGGVMGLRYYFGLVPFVIIFYSALYIYIKGVNEKATLSNKNHI